jgi:energy-coupling factor transporter ATP-binding protein EcfA2
MPTASGSYLYSQESGRDWIEKILPSVWEELCTNFGIRAGVVVLKSWEEDSFYESASFGYEEDGFYYSFLARGEPGWNRIKNQKFPITFSSSDVSLFCETGIASVIGIHAYGSNEFVGFLLAEWEEEDRSDYDPLLYLFAEKIGRERGVQVVAEEFVPAKGQAMVGDTAPLIAGLVSSLQEKIVELKSEKILSIFGPSGSGKKTLAKWIHHQSRPNKTCLFLASIPEHLGKLEKALVSWGAEANSGTLVFLGPKKWSLGQQKIVMDWALSSDHHCQVIFVDSAEEALEILPGFSKLLRKNFIQIPGFSFLEKQALRHIILALFRDLCKDQNRNGLQLEESGIRSLLERNYPNHFSDLKNILLSGILKSKGNLIQESELESDISKLNLGVPDAEDLDLRSGIQALERQKILNAMRIFSGNQIRMAKALGISRGALQNKMKQLGLL